MASLAAKRVLDAVERWADKYWLCRETGVFVEGRIDALLVPTAFDAHCVKQIRGHYSESIRVCGVEVKTDRGDFLRGLKKGQYDRYSKTLGGLYLATFRDTCRTAEVPLHCGHLVCLHGEVVCKRHPRYRKSEFTQEQMWQLFFRYVLEHRREVYRERDRVHESLEKMGHRAAGEVFAALRAIRKQVEAKGQTDAERNRGPEGAGTDGA